MTWSEVMSRISILLTIESASLVVVGLTVQVTGFGHAFHVLAVGLSAAMLVHPATIRRHFPPETTSCRVAIP
jgi:hypothetical protein